MEQLSLKAPEYLAVALTSWEQRAPAEPGLGEMLPAAPDSALKPTPENAASGPMAPAEPGPALGSQWPWSITFVNKTLLKQTTSAH